MRTELVTSANRVAIIQADGLNRCEQWTLAQIEANVTPLLPVLLPLHPQAAEFQHRGRSTTIPRRRSRSARIFLAAASDPTQDQTYGFGIVDESGKLNLNGATSDQLLSMQHDQAVTTSITSWPKSACKFGNQLHQHHSDL